MTFTYKEGVNDELPDLDGFDVEATDGHIGKIFEATYETGRACFLVDTGHWIFGALRLIPAGPMPAARRRHRGCRAATSDRLPPASRAGGRRLFDSTGRRAGCEV